MKQLKLFEVQQECDYHYIGITSFADLVEIVREYPFDEEVMEKAKIQKANMGTPFSATLRINPTAVITEGEEKTEFSFEDYEICDGRSKCAAIGLLEPEELEGSFVKLHVFVLEKEKMDLL